MVLDSDEFITHTTCNCPYEYGIYCKHQVAAFYAVKESKTNKDSYIQPYDIRQALLQKSNEELITIICDILNQYPEMETKLLFQHASDHSDVNSCSQIINEYIHAVQDRGFIEYRDVSYAVQGAELVLEKVDQTVTDGDTVKAVHMCIIVLSMMIDMLQGCDDSDGIVGGIIDESIASIDHIVSTYIDTMSESTQQQIFQILLQEASHERHDDWNEWEFALLNICIYFCTNPEWRRQLDDTLEQMISSNSKEGWSGTYRTSQCKKIQLQLIQLYDGSSKEEAFIQTNLQYSEFREKAIQHAFHLCEYEKVIKLCLDGEQQDKNALGLLKKWNTYRYEAYENLGDIENQRKLGLAFVLKDDFTYYEKLKVLYDPSSWLEIREYILSTFESTAYRSHMYESILILERLPNKLLAYCQKHPATILHLYESLLPDYPSETHQIFITHMQDLAQVARDRKMYKNICQIIQTYQRVGDKKLVQEFIEQLKQTYHKRPAFLDELKKISNSSTPI
ncbi:SWIM zinc finger family protein [Bacillus thuringiensis]|nr:SWIM zinc finger family protein [Bacillus thuringiensis]